MLSSEPIAKRSLTAALLVFLGAGLSGSIPSTLAQPANIRPAEPKLIYLEIASFEAAGSEPHRTLNEAGPKMLSTEMLNGNSNHTDIQVAIVEERLNPVLNIIGREQRLGGRSPNRETLKAVKPEYVILCTYSKIGERYQIHARLVTVDNAADVGAAEHSFNQDIPNALRPLAMKLRRELVKAALGIRVAVRRHRLKVCEFSIPGISDEWSKLTAQMIRNSIVTALTEMQLQDIAQIMPESDCLQHTTSPVEAAPDISELHVTGTLLVEKDAQTGQKTMHLSVQIVHEGSVAASSEEICISSIPREKIGDLVNRLREGWETHLAQY